MWSRLYTRGEGQEKITEVLFLEWMNVTEYYSYSSIKIENMFDLTDSIDRVK